MDILDIEIIVINNIKEIISFLIFKINHLPNIIMGDFENFMPKNDQPEIFIQAGVRINQLHAHINRIIPPIAGSKLISASSIIAPIFPPLHRIHFEKNCTRL